MRTQFRGLLFLLLSFCHVSCALRLHAQTPAAPARAPDAYGKEPFVIETMSRRYDLKADGTGTYQMTSVVRVQAEAALRQYGVVTVAYASASQKVEFHYVRTRHPDGAVTETPLSGVQEQTPEVTREAPSYSDIKLAQLPVKNLQTGDRLEWEARVVTLKPEAPGQFWGSENFSRNQGVVLEEQVQLNLPAGTYVQVWTNPRVKVAAQASEAGGQRTLTWRTASLTPTVGPEAEQAKKRKEATLLTEDELLDVRKGKLPDVAWTTFHSWDEVGAWYRGLQAERDEPDAAIKAKVAEVTQGKATTEEKLRAVYTYVSTQVRYIGVSFGIGRYQPHTAAAVLDNQYGDCKDKHTLLAAMIRSLGLEPRAVLIGAGIRFNDAVPSPASFNHLITQVEVDGQPVWLDSTEEVAPYKALMQPIREEQALVVPASGIAKVETTPASLPYPAYARATVKGSLADDLTSESEITLVYRDDDEMMARAVLRQISAAQYEEFVQRFVAGMGFGGTTSQASISPVDDLAQPLTISFHYHRAKEPDWGENRITVAFMPVVLPVVDDKKPPTGELALGTPRVESSSVEVKLPPGWKSELPGAVHSHSEFADCDVTYKVVDGKLIAERTLTIHKPLVPATAWKSYKKWYDDAGASGVPYVQLDPPAKRAASAEAEALASNAEAAGLVRQALEAMQHDDLKGAHALVEQAKQINVTERGLWAASGYLNFRSGDAGQAILDYRKELALHPGESGTYRSLMQTQILAEQRDNALQTAQMWSEEDLQNPEPVTAQVSLLLEGGRAQEAVKAGDAAMNRLPETARGDPSLQLAMGRAEAAAGLRQRAEKTLTPLLHAEQRLTQNDAAYYLADAGLALTQDEEAEADLLKALAEESQSWTLDESAATTRATSSLLVASWDTMGWILFKEKKTAAAETYLQAAWRNSGRAVIGEHLGEVEAALGHHEKALAAYCMAEASAVRFNNLGVRQPPSAEALSLEKKIREEQQAHPGLKPEDAKTELQKLRVVPLGSAPDAGTAEYRLLLAKGRVAQLVPLKTQQTLPAAETDLVSRADLSSFFPAGSEAQLLRKGMLNCHAGRCDLVLEP